MTVREACSLLGCSLRQLHYILKAAGIPGGERTRAGYLTPRAADAVRAILAARQPVQPSVQSDAGETARLWTAYETLYAETVYLRAELSRLQSGVEAAYRAACETATEHEGRLAALEQTVPVRASWWLRARRVVAAETETVRRVEYAPTFEAWAERMTADGRH